LAYVAGRIRAAGGSGAQIFTREAVVLMHERSRGIPRMLSVIADNALVAGFATDQRPIRAAVIEEVCRDLDVDRSVTVDLVPEHDEEPEATGKRGHMLTFTSVGADEAMQAEGHHPTLVSDAGDGAGHEREPGDAALTTVSETAGLESEALKRRRFGFF
jgi:hypothetical protein